MSTTTEKQIFFSAPMVRAILTDSKTQTRRAVKNADWFGCLTGDCLHDRQTECDASLANDCPYGGVGDRLWVRETWQQVYDCANGQRHTASQVKEGYGRIIYAATLDEEEPPKWRPSIFMPRWASRIALEITSVRVERLQDISDADLEAEGFYEEMSTPHAGRLNGEKCLIAVFDKRLGFQLLWEKINGKKHPWQNNPFVWVLTFRKV